MARTWEKEGFKLYACKDGYIMNYTMGASESIEKEICAKGTIDVDSWIVAKDDSFTYYTTVIDPLSQGVGIEVFKGETVKGKIVKLSMCSEDVFNAFGGGKILSFQNYGIEYAK